MIRRFYQAALIPPMYAVLGGFKAWLLQSVSTLSQVPPLASIRAEFLHGGTCDKVLTVSVSCDRTTL